MSEESNINSSKITDEECLSMLQTLIDAFKEINRLWDDGIKTLIPK